MAPRSRRPADMPVMAEKCATCPFRLGGWEVLRADIERRVLGYASQTCHSTGVALDPPREDTHLCRGARDVQLRHFHEIGFLDEPTDEAWAAKCRAMGIPMKRSEEERP